MATLSPPCFLQGSLGIHLLSRKPKPLTCLLLPHSKNLTWRDMQHLVVRTSKPAHLNANDWATNGVGRKGES